MITELYVSWLFSLDSKAIFCSVIISFSVLHCFMFALQKHKGLVCDRFCLKGFVDLNYSVNEYVPNAYLPVGVFLV